MVTTLTLARLVQAAASGVPVPCHQDDPGLVILEVRCGPLFAAIAREQDETAAQLIDATRTTGASEQGIREQLLASCSATALVSVHGPVIPSAGDKRTVELPLPILELLHLRKAAGSTCDVLAQWLGTNADGLVVDLDRAIVLPVQHAWLRVGADEKSKAWKEARGRWEAKTEELNESKADICELESAITKLQEDLITARLKARRLESEER